MKLGNIAQIRRATRWTNLSDVLDKPVALPLQCSTGLELGSVPLRNAAAQARSILLGLAAEKLSEPGRDTRCDGRRRLRAWRGPTWCDRAPGLLWRVDRRPVFRRTTAVEREDRQRVARGEHGTAQKPRAVPGGRQVGAARGYPGQALGTRGIQHRHPSSRHAARSNDPPTRRRRRAGQGGSGLPIAFAGRAGRLARWLAWRRGGKRSGTR